LVGAAATGFAAFALAFEFERATLAFAGAFDAGAAQDEAKTTVTAIKQSKYIVLITISFSETSCSTLGLDVFQCGNV
jgi:hypothetical protein